MLTHRSELEQVGVHRDVVEDLDAVRHDPRDEEQPPLLEKMVALLIFVPNSHFNLSATAFYQNLSKKKTFLSVQGVPCGHIDLVWLTWIFPLSAQLCLGWWEYGISGLAAEQKGGKLKSKATKPRSMTRYVTLY